MAKLAIETSVERWVQDFVEEYVRNPIEAHMWDSTVAGGNGILTTLLLRPIRDTRWRPLGYQETDGSYVVMATNGGARKHPRWFRLLEVEPRCRVRIAAEEFDAVTRIPAASERDRLFAKMERAFPPLFEYQRLAGKRQIPAVLIERVG